MTPERLRRLSALWDACAEVAPAARAAWLAGLPTADAELREDLQRMIDLDAQPASGHVRLGSGPPAFDDTTGPHGGSGLPERHSAGERVGPYRLDSLLGRGGMGEVWRAQREDALLNRAVAVKLPLVLAGRQALRLRFEREREILAALTHPNIARLYDAGLTADGQPYMAMELVPGQNLMLHSDARRLTLAQRVALFLQVADAVQHAHTQGVIHRDLKPSNILVTEAGEVRLLDFGIAKMLQDGSAAEWPSAGPQPSPSSALTRELGHAMTLDYASPEQVQLLPVGTLSDLYSLGVLLYELLAGQRPYRLAAGGRPARGELEAAILRGDQPAPSSRIEPAAAAARQTTVRALARQLRGDLDTIVLKALRPQPGQRYASVAALADDLRRWQAGRPVLAQPDSRWYRSWRFVQRHRWAAAGAALTLAGLALGLGVALWQAQQAQTQRLAAEATESFLLNLFKANAVDQDDPAQAQQTTARELLDRGAQRAGDELAQAPQARLRMLKTLAGLYNDLALFEPAYRLQTQRLALVRQQGGGDRAALASELIDTARIAFTTSADPPQGKTLLDEADALLNAAGVQGGALRGRLDLARAVQFDADNCAAAPHALRGVEALRAAAPGSDLIDGLLLVAQTQSYCGSGDTALAAAQEAMGLMERTQQRAQLAKALAAASGAYWKLGRYDEGMDAGRKALATSLARHPADATPDDDSLQLAASLTSKLLEAWPRQALAVSEPVLARALREPMRADKDGSTVLLLRQGQARLGLREVDAAAADIERAARLLASFDADPGLQALVYDAVGDVRTAQGRWTEADEALQRAAGLHEKLGHRGTPQANNHVARRVRLALARGRADDAARELQAFVLKSPPGPVPTRAQLEVWVLKAEIAALRRDWPAALELTANVSRGAAARPAPAWVRDLSLRALQVEAAALQATGTDAAARTRLAAAQSLADAMQAPDQPRPATALAAPPRQ